ncbi:hypothetical protein [Vibrio hepatarius]|uniref:hypothetical protein n=1 Tax=Vibrio hepatarius TaxID=171383 RepID=UPI002FDB7B49
MAAKLSWQELLLCSAPAAILAEALDNCSRALLASVMALASSAVEEAIRSAACCCLQQFWLAYVGLLHALPKQLRYQ